MKKIITCKCVLLTFFSFISTAYASEYKSVKLRSFSEVPKVKKSRNHNKYILNEIKGLIADDIDLEFFDKHKLGWSIYAKISKNSRLGFRYNY